MPNQFGKKFFHLGPKRDSSIFEKVKENKSTIDNCDFILCTGLFDEQETELNGYKKFFIKRSCIQKINMH